TTCPRTDSRNSWMVASPSTGAIVWLMSLSFGSGGGSSLGSASLRGLRDSLAQAPQPLLDVGHPERVVSGAVTITRVGEQGGRPLCVAAEQCDVCQPGEGGGDPPLPARRPEHRAGFLERALGLLEPALCEREVRGSPQRAGEAPSIAGTP